MLSYSKGKNQGTITFKWKQTESQQYETQCETSGTYPRSSELPRTSRAVPHLRLCHHSIPGPLQSWGWTWELSHDIGVSKVLGWPLQLGWTFTNSFSGPVFKDSTPSIWWQASASLYDPFTPGASTLAVASHLPIAFPEFSWHQASAVPQDLFMPSKHR